MRPEPIARQRRHTLLFLDGIRGFAPVFLDTEVDMTRVSAHRVGARYSLVTYVLHTVARVLARHPEANAAIHGRFRPRVARYPSVHGKLALDKTIDGHRVVLSAIVPDAHRATLDDIQRRVDHVRDGDPAELPEFAGARLMHRLPGPLGRAAFRLGVRPLRRRPAVLGTFSVTSLAHRPVDGFYSVGGTTVTVGLGRVADRPVVRDGRVEVAPRMRLSLTFDHRVIDGAEAADVLAAIKAGLETFGTETPTGGNDVDELRRHVVVHARSQRISEYRDLLERIADDGSWVQTWSTAAAARSRRGDHLAAARRFAMARFPFVDGPARQHAQDRCVDSFDRWRKRGKRKQPIERLDVDLPGGRVRCWTAGLSAAERRPLLLIMGGIVTVKEQWAPILASVHRLGMAGIVTELPGVGENTLRYDAKSWQMLSGILDAVADGADVTETYAMTLSFSGHLALRCAVDDNRIRGVITTGAPVRQFFTDPAWLRTVPQITLDTLAHLTGVGLDGLADALDDFALTDEQIAALDIPVRYVASRRDEIIPAGDVARLARLARDVTVLEHDDVHGSPGHVAETQLWCLRELLRMRGVRGPVAAGVGLLWHLRRTRRRGK